MATWTAAALSSLLNGYRIAAGPPKQIVIPHASKIPSLEEVSVMGRLLPKQFIRLDPATNKRTPAYPSNKKYSIEAGDGDLHFCVGDKAGRPHIACELPRATPALSLFQQSVGQQIAVSGLLRCMFEHPGFKKVDDAHVFEIHPVHSVTLGGTPHVWDIYLPDQKSLHQWIMPTNLNVQDGRIKVSYSRAADELTFTGMDGMDENYVELDGKISNVTIRATSPAPSMFAFHSPAFEGRTLESLCLKGTTAAAQLARLGTRTDVHLVALRNIDLTQAMKNRYVITLLAIDIK